MRPARFATLFVAVAAFAAGTAQAAANPFLELVVEDSRLREGASEALVVVRANTVRALSAGTLVLDLFNRDDLVGPAFTGLLEARVLSGSNDAVVTPQFDLASQRTTVDFSSASGSVNAAVGPIAVLRFGLEPGLLDGRRFDLRLRGGLTLVTPTDGEPVYLDDEHGDLRIVKSDAKMGVDAEGGEFAPGQDVLVGASAEILGPIASGSVELVFDPAFAAGPATAVIPPDYGTGVVDSISEPSPGHVVVTFHSPAQDLNTLLPGPFVFVSIPSSDLVAPNTVFPIHLGAATALLDPDGKAIELELVGDTIRMHDNEHVFESGFEDVGMDDFSEVHEGAHG